MAEFDTTGSDGARADPRHPNRTRRRELATIGGTKFNLAICKAKGVFILAGHGGLLVELVSLSSGRQAKLARTRRQGTGVKSSLVLQKTCVGVAGATADLRQKSCSR